MAQQLIRSSMRQSLSRSLDLVVGMQKKEMCRIKHKAEGQERCCVVCGVWCVVCGVWCVVCGVWWVVCGVGCVVCGVWCGVCGVWCVVCGVWCVVCCVVLDYLRVFLLYFHVISRCCWFGL